MPTTISTEGAFHPDEHLNQTKNLFHENMYEGIGNMVAILSKRSLIGIPPHVCR